MLGFPTAFTLMGMGMIFTFIAYSFSDPSLALNNTLSLMVQRAYAVMTNDVLISIPLFVFMGYLVERANLIEKLFRSLHLALVRVPGSLAVATIVTCAIFATATGIVGAVVTLMGLLAFPARLYYCWRLFGHFDSALSTPDCLWRDRRCFSRAALCRRIFPRNYVGRFVHRLRHYFGQIQAKTHAATRT
jgi:hypothetical protein